MRWRPFALRIEVQNTKIRNSRAKPDRRTGLRSLRTSDLPVDASPPCSRLAGVRGVGLFLDSGRSRQLLECPDHFLRNGLVREGAERAPFLA